MPPAWSGPASRGSTAIPCSAPCSSRSRRSGLWRIALECQVSATQRYLKNTPILVTRLTDADGGAADVYDFCPRLERRGRMYRPVAFVRIVRPLAGAPRIKVVIAPATAWGAREA